MAEFPPPEGIPQIVFATQNLTPPTLGDSVPDVEIRPDLFASSFRYPSDEEQRLRRADIEVTRHEFITAWAKNTVRLEWERGLKTHQPVKAHQETAPLAEVVAIGRQEPETGRILGHLTLAEVRRQAS